MAPFSCVGGDQNTFAPPFPGVARTFVGALGTPGVATVVVVVGATVVVVVVGGRVVVVVVVATVVVVVGATVVVVVGLLTVKVFGPICGPVWRVSHGIAAMGWNVGAVMVVVGSAGA